MLISIHVAAALRHTTWLIPASHTPSLVGELLEIGEAPAFPAYVMGALRRLDHRFAISGLLDLGRCFSTAGCCSSLCLVP